MRRQKMPVGVVPVELYREIQGQERANSESGGFGQKALSLYELDTSKRIGNIIYRVLKINADSYLHVIMIKFYVRLSIVILL